MQFQFLRVFTLQATLLILSYLHTVAADLPIDNDGKFFEIIRNSVDQILNQAINNDTENLLSQTCKEAYRASYMDKNASQFYYYKLLKDSSKNKNDVGSFNDCMLNKYSSTVNNTVLDNFTYLIINIDKVGGINITDTRYEQESYMFGMCTVEGCSDQETVEILNKINVYFGDPLGLKSKESIKVMNVSKYKNNQRRSTLITIISLIPFYMLVFQILLVWFTKIPMTIFRCCFREKREGSASDNFLNPIMTDENSSGINNSEDLQRIREIGAGRMERAGTGRTTSTPSNDGNNIITSPLRINKFKLFKFKNAFSIAHNGEELFSSKSTEYNNDSGLNYLRGIKGLFMSFMVIGNVFLVLFNSPVKIYGEASFVKLLRSFWFSLIFIGVRYAPRILFSCSGFSFIYKYLNYLDDKANEIDTPGADNNTNTLITNPDNSNIIRNSSNHSYSYISYRVLLTFLLSQLYKYLIFLWITIFFKYSYYFIFALQSDSGPMWVYFKINVIDKMNWTYLLGHIFLYEPFKFEDTENPSHYIFWMCINEISFFIFSSIIVFIGFKKNFRIDLFFYLVLFGLIVARYTFYSVLENVYPTLFFYFNAYGFLSINPLYNYPYYLIGIFFGKMNYVIQKGLKVKGALKSGKRYMLSVIYFTRMFRNKSKCLYITYTFLGLMLLALLSILMPIIVKFTNYKENHLSNFFTDPTVNSYFLIDVEIVVILIHTVAFSLYLMGENYLHSFLTNSFWASKSRFYFSYLLLINPFIIYLFYRSESRIKMDIFTLIFFSMVVYMVMIILSSLAYIFIELPYKKISKMIIKK